MSATGAASRTAVVTVAASQPGAGGEVGSSVVGEGAGHVVGAVGDGVGNGVHGRDERVDGSRCGAEWGKAVELAVAGLLLDHLPAPVRELRAHPSVVGGVLVVIVGVRGDLEVDVLDELVVGTGARTDGTRQGERWRGRRMGAWRSGGENKI